ncbi:hypothetical protein M422DRAFT_268779 [Sphaerobolus stellatus SS14]|uniref:DUF6534 domain-containing protein n=1 Tax=Sphaerobolus stellatus (strain SS14) TaxID=990650 RepID=A0A0C9UWP8_SPHS4|nr:hypothetical protein M422DRAFT_268779 [Sphaerobolus stellatus SS14]
MPGSVVLLFGPMLIGAWLNAILYGILVLQIFMYLQTFKKEATWMRYFVLYLLVVETLNTGFNLGIVYEPLVQRYGTERATTRVPVMLETEPIMTVLIASPVQLFIAWRIKIISGSRRMAALISFFAIASFAGGIVGTVESAIKTDYSQLQEFKGAVITWLIAAAAADILITGTLVYSLHKRKTGNSYSDAMVNRIIRLTLQTGALTALFATADVVLFLAVPHTTLNFIWDFPLCKLYTNALLSTLNARAGWSNLNGQPHPNNVLFGTPAVEGNINSDYKHRRSIYTSTTIELKVPTQQSMKDVTMPDDSISMKYELPDLEAGGASEMSATVKEVESSLAGSSSSAF